MTQRFAAAGAPHVALARIESLQPASPSAARWGEWEQLRCTLMQRLNRHRALIERVAAMPPNAPAQAQRACLAQGARAANAIADGVAARDFLARLIWTHELPADELRQARLLVIDSYLAQGNARDAYILMLRYEQDFKPLDPPTATHFVEALLARGMEKEAVNWLSQLSEASAVKLLLRLKTNLITPAAALAEAREALARRGAGASYWVVAQHAAAAQNNRVAVAESFEHLLQTADDKAPVRIDALAGELWKAYDGAAQDLANQHQLLVGDDANWADFAARRLSSSAPAARALFAALALRGQASSARLGAQLQLVHALQGSGLGLTALRLFSDAARFPVDKLDPQARYLLGVIAADSDRPQEAARYWQGLDTPPALAPDEWRLKLADVLLRAGAHDAAAQALLALVADRQPLSASTVQRAAELVRRLKAGGRPGAVTELYRALLPLSQPAQRREILFGLGTAAESEGDFPRAADHFLEAALLLEGRAPDALALNARLQAAVNLARAGFNDDARAQLGWLEKNVSDAEKLELVRREMRNLSGAQK
jgi:TolA-binding protein